MRRRGADRSVALFEYTVFCSTIVLNVIMVQVPVGLSVLIVHKIIMHTVGPTCTYTGVINRMGDCPPS